jgi:hypothetical protein
MWERLGEFKLIDSPIDTDFRRNIGVTSEQELELMRIKRKS